MDEILEQAPTAFPAALAMGKSLVDMDEDILKEAYMPVMQIIPNIEQCIAMQYAISILAAQKVYLCGVYCLARSMLDAIIMMNMQVLECGKARDSECAWEFFREYVAPEVQKHKVKASSDCQDQLGELVLQYASKVPLYKVRRCLIIES